MSPAAGSSCVLQGGSSNASATHTRSRSTRVVAATHSELAKMVAEGSFREDLFYRLNVLPVPLPPLRDRREDIPLLVRHFIQRLAQDSGRTGMTVSQEAMRRLMAYRWPGNVRQLENTVERALAFTQGRSVIDVQDLAPEIQNHSGTVEGPSRGCRGRDRLRALYRGHRAVAHPAVARTHPGQQAPGRVC